MLGYSLSLWLNFACTPDLFVIHGQELYYTAVQCRREGYVWLGKQRECMSALAVIFMSSYFGYSVNAERRGKLIAGGYVNLQYYVKHDI